MATQLYVPGMGGSVLGVRYADCAAVLEVYGLNDPEVWDGLRIVESAYVEAMRAQTESRRAKGRASRG